MRTYFATVIFEGIVFILTMLLLSRCAQAEDGVMVLAPPARFDHAYHGTVIEIAVPLGDARKLCAMKFVWADACAWVEHGICHIVLPTTGAPVSDLGQYRHHEIAHCNGWPADHPP